MNNKIFMSRRSFLKSAAIAASGISLQALIPSIAQASGTARLLVINLNGGLDGLAALQPSEGAVYDALRQLRPTLAKDPATLLAASSGLSFHPKLGILKSLFDQRALSTVLNVGCRNMSRSHLEAEIALTRGVTDRMSATSSGLINRIGSQYGWSSLRAIGVTGDDPIFAGGDYRAVQARDLDDLYFRAFDGNYHAVDQLVGTMYEVAAGSDSDSNKPSQKEYVTNLQTVINNTDAVQDGVKGTTFVQSYQQNQFGKALRSAEISFRAPQIASQVVYMRPIGFDTHSGQSLRLNQLLDEFGSALQVFVNNMVASGVWNDLVVLIISEFGRTTPENGSQGTDHGGANAVFALGGRVNGGQIIGSLSPGQLKNFGWLQPVYNYAELYRQALIPLGIDPDRIIPATDGPLLAGLFK